MNTYRTTLAATCTVLLVLASGAARGSESSISDDLKGMRAEVAKAEAEGYPARAVERLLVQAQTALRGGKAEAAQEYLRRAKGMLISLKMPRWAHDMRFARSKSKIPDFQRTTPTYRDVVSMGREWGEWACVARPMPQSQEQIDESHKSGYHVVCYIEGTLSPITMVLMPGCVNRTNDKSASYANNYWHHGEEWWGLSGVFPGHRQWIADQMELLARMEFDGVELDSAFSTPRFDARGVKYDTKGGWVEMQQVIKRHPRFVFSPNVTGNQFIDDRTLKYNTATMKEVIGSPAQWDDGPMPAGFGSRLRLTAERNYNVPLWGVFYLFNYFRDKGYEMKPGGQAYMDLGYAASIAHKVSPCTGSLGPTLKMQRFAHAFSDYIFLPTVEVFTRQDRVKVRSKHRNLRWSVSARSLLNGKEELLIHLYNAKAADGPIKNLQLSLLRSGANLPDGARITFLSPQTEPQDLPVVMREAGVYEVTVPSVPIWSILVLGAPLLPRAEVATAHERYVAGSSINVEVNLTHRLGKAAKYAVSLQVPEGWTATPERERITLARKQKARFRVAVSPDANEGLYALTPVVTDEAGNAAHGWSKQIDIVPALSFRWKPVFVRAPSKHTETVKLHVRNNTEKQGQATLQIEFPEGWRERVAPRSLKLPARGEAAVDVRLMPKDLNLRLWEFQDVEAKISCRFGDKSLTAALPLRAFPQVFHVAPGDGLGIFRTGGRYYGHKYRPWGYPQLKFLKAGPAKATARLKTDYVVLWVTAENYAQYKGKLAEFVRLGGGLIVTDVRIEETDLLPVELGETATLNTLKLLPSPLTASAHRLRKEFPGKFRATKVKVKDWGKVIAEWGDGSPAIVVSRKPGVRVAFVGSRLKGDYTFGTQTKPIGRAVAKQKWRSNLWLLTAVYNEMFRWAAGMHP